MTIKPAVQGDVHDSRIIRLDGLDNLDTVESLVAHVKRGATTVDLDCSVLDAADRTVRVELGADDGWLASLDDASAGVAWDFEIEVTFDDGSVLTWPSGSMPESIYVRRRLD